MVLHLFDLPVEVRDLIYAQCVLVDGGYVLDFDSNTLRRADGKPIDLSFRLACKRIASETRGLALSSNTLNFSTFHSQKHHAAAGRFHLLVEYLWIDRGEAITDIEPGVMVLPDDIWDDIATAHPRFAPYVDVCRNRPDRSTTWTWDANVGPPGSCGDTPSAFRDFIFSAFRTIVSNKHRLDKDQLFKLREMYEGGPVRTFEPLIHANPDPWSIIDAESVEAIINSMDSMFVESVDCWWRSEGPGVHKFCREEQRYSAAATAIRFLESLTPDSRASIRSVVLNEDRRSVAFPECHGLGLVPFCKENPRIRIERRVSMWRTAFQTALTRHSTTDIIIGPYASNLLTANSISCPVAVWIVEALELEAAGMPSGCFTLTLDGDSTCSEIFQTVVRRDAAWHTAIDLCLERGILPPLPWDVRRRDSRIDRCHADSGWQKNNRWYTFEAFPKAVEDIVAGRSIIKCGFELGDAWGVACDPERLIEENKGWTMAQWKEGWFVREKESFDPDPPSPTWLQLLCENSLDRTGPITDDMFHHALHAWAANSNSEE